MIPSFTIRQEQISHVFLQPFLPLSLPSFALLPLLFLDDDKKQYFTNKDVDDLSMSGAYNTNGNGTTAWYDTTPGVEVYVGDKALKIDRASKTVYSEQGKVRTSRKENVIFG